ncbi:MAG TPA: RecX family transcriptional regulator [Baekduia sp.]|nr:RecX family transcriptional regulator [Baekduia sp.]
MDTRSPERAHLDALDLSYRYLGMRDRTTAEVRAYLASKEVGAAAVEGALTELQDQGYLNDARFAVAFAEDRRNLDDWGSERIGRRLQALGVEQELIDSALTRDRDDELDAAVALLGRRFSDAPSDDRERQRALGVLVRKGFDLDLSYEAIRSFASQRS